jgi:hypothetical protein
MSEADESGRTDEEDVFEFVAGGESCERCEALDGSRWSEPPSLPHAYCNCEITPVDAGSADDWGSTDACGNSWEAETTGNVEFYGPADDPSLEWEVQITVECADGSGGEFLIYIDSGRDSAYDSPEDRGAYIWSEAYDEGDELMAQVCQCVPKLLS